MKTFKRLIFYLGAGALFSLSGLAQPNHGILVMAHGGSERWNAAVQETVKNANLSSPVRVFFGMGCTKKEADDLHRQIQDLEKEGVRSIVVVPLIISSYSEVYRQWRYLLGLEARPGFDPKMMAHRMGPEHAGMNMFEDVSPVDHHAAIAFPHGLDDDPVVSEILLKRAREISQAPAQESVIIVAHGPNEEADNRLWLANLQRIAAAIQEKGRFKEVEGATLRDDAPPEVRQQAVQHLRDRVSALGKGGQRVLVVPLLLAPGGIEQKIGTDLKGLTYIFNPHTLLPETKLVDWIREHSV